MLPDPLHPAIVHFPIVFAILTPVIAVAVLWAIRRRGGSPRALWSVALVAYVALAGSAVLATRTGEQQEDRVERVVPEAALEAHEEAGERFQYAALAALLVAAIGLAPGGIGAAARVGATAAAIVLLLLSWQVGSSGGELVYRHGAASAYTSAAPSDTAGRGHDDD